MFFDSEGFAPIFFYSGMVGRDEDRIWRCFMKFTPEGKKYFDGRSLGCTKEMPGICVGLKICPARFCHRDRPKIERAR